MSATTVMSLGLLAEILGRWAHNQKAISVPGVVGAVFSVIVVSALDNGATAPIARGIAWIFFAAVILSKNSPITGIAAAINRKPPTTPKGK
jgi:hypothetical protein